MTNRQQVKDYLVCNGGQYTAEYIADKLGLKAEKVQKIFHGLIHDKASNIRLVGYDKNDCMLIRWMTDSDTLSHIYGFMDDPDMAGVIEGEGTRRGDD